MKRHCVAGFAVLAGFLLVVGAVAQEQKKLKVYVSVDMEGIGGGGNARPDRATGLGLSPGAQVDDG